MILYFSGTGNSRHAARRIAEGTGDEIIDLFGMIKSHDYDNTEIHSDTPWVIVTPTYAWRIPHIVEELLKKLSLTGNKRIYFVMTCGDSIGNAGKYLEPLSAEKSMIYSGCYELVMPENYIAMFKTPEKSEALKIIKRAEPEIDKIIEMLKAGKEFPERHITFAGKICSGFINDMFYPAFVHAKKFYTTDKCISCGKCERVCPLNNIRLVDGRPLWADNCTHCMACISKCPWEAIEYGKHSRGLPRYVFPESVTSPDVQDNSVQG